METLDLAELIKGRRSIRVMQDKPVPQELLMQAIEMATWAPNGANAQGWHFYVILNRGIIESIADTIQKVMTAVIAWPELAGAQPPQPPGTPPGGLLQARFKTIRSAPAFIVVTCKKMQNPMEKAIAERAKTDSHARQILESLQIVSPRIQSVAAAISYLLLALHQMGMGATWMTGPLQAKADLEKLLSIPADQDIVALIPVGYPAENPVNSRKPVSEVCTVLK